MYHNVISFPFTRGQIDQTYQNCLNGKKNVRVNEMPVQAGNIWIK